MRTALALSLVSTVAALAAAIPATFAATEDAPIVIARADDLPGDRHGRGQDNLIKRQGADNAPGDNRRGRGQDDLIKRRGADNPPGDNRRGRGHDDPPNHG